MLRLSAGQVESLWDEVLPGEVRELPEDLRGVGSCCCQIRGCWRRSRRAGSARAGSWAADDLDADLRAVDGDQAPHRLGVRDVDAGGLGLAASAPVLSDRAWGAGAGRVDGAQAHPPARGGGGERDHEDGDREGPAGEAVSAAGGADRLDGGRGRRALPDRFGVGVGLAHGCWRGRRASCWRRSAGTRAVVAIARGRSAGGCGR